MTKAAPHANHSREQQRWQSIRRARDRGTAGTSGDPCWQNLTATFSMSKASTDEKRSTPRDCIAGVICSLKAMVGEAAWVCSEGRKVYFVGQLQMLCYEFLP